MTSTDPQARRWLLVVAAASAAAVTLVLAGVLVTLTLIRPDAPATPVAQTSPQPSPTRDARGEQACADLEEMESREYDAYTRQDSLRRVAGFGRQAADEDVREQSQILHDIVNVPWDEWDTSTALDAEQQVLQVIAACDAANYAF